MVMIVGNNTAYPIKQFCKVLHWDVSTIPDLLEGKMCVWDMENKTAPLFTATEQ
jgi:hypothetical protein